MEFLDKLALVTIAEMLQNLLTILIIIASFYSSFSQERESYPDYLVFGEIENVSKITFIDKQEKLVKRKIQLDNNGKTIHEYFSDYLPVIGKHAIDGKFKYEYNDNNLLIERFYTNDNEDTLKVLFYYTYKGYLKKKVDWEYERKLKLRKGAPKYGDGTPYGCIPAEEDLIDYREWTVRRKKKFFLNRNRLTKVKVPYEWKMQPRIWKYQYDNLSQLVEKSEFDTHGTLHWTEKYSYRDSLIVKSKEYFITYWGKLPPKEIINKTFNNESILRIATEFVDTSDKELITFRYETERLVEIVKYKNDKIVLNYLIEYK